MLDITNKSVITGNESETVDVGKDSLDILALILLFFILTIRVLSNYDAKTLSLLYFIKKKCGDISLFSCKWQYLKRLTLIFCFPASVTDLYYYLLNKNNGSKR